MYNRLTAINFLKMFEKVTDLNALNLSKFLKWNVGDINELLSKRDLNDTDIYNFYKVKLGMKKAFTEDEYFQGNMGMDYMGCGVCGTYMDKKLMTKVEGTYKYHHVKLNTTTYHMCPMCLYLSANNKKYANLASELTTNDEEGIVECRPSKTSSDQTNWVIVHPRVLNRHIARDKFGCFIDPRFCVENN